MRSLWWSKKEVWTQRQTHSGKKMWRHTERRGPCGWSDSCTGPGKLDAKREAWTVPSLGLQSKCGAANTLILDFCPPEMWDDKFLLFEATRFVVLCFSNPRKNNTLPLDTNHTDHNNHHPFVQFSKESLWHENKSPKVSSFSLLSWLENSDFF